MKLELLKKYKSLNFEKFNTDMDSFVNSNNIKSETNYLLITNLKTKYTYVYKRINNKWVRLYKWQSTIGKPSNPTRKGMFLIDEKRENFYGKTYSLKFAIRIVDNYYYHSILYKNDGVTIKDDRLGYELSLGCIRLATKNAKWIYDNIPEGTVILIH